jgi:anti-sigma factor RsiW
MDKYVNEGLFADEQKPFEDHLHSCSSCQEQLRDLQALVGMLRNAPPLPPVPEGFSERLMARANRQVARAEPVRPWLLARAGWRDYGQVLQVAGSLGAVAAALLLGVVMAQQTWRYAGDGDSGDSRRAAMQVDPELVYELDFLSGAPRGSFIDAYLNLTRIAGNGET